MNRGRNNAALETSAAKDRLADMGLVRPAVPVPIGNFDLGSIDGTTQYPSGQGPLPENGTPATGKIGRDVSAEEAATAHAEFDRVAILLGPDDLLDRKPHQLSGGQAQRVTPGRAMLRKPSAFLLHKPPSIWIRNSGSRCAEGLPGCNAISPQRPSMSLTTRSKR